MMIAGLDEAGKGPVVGSMFVAGILIDENRMETLEKLRVADSKKIAPNRREYLAKMIQKTVDQHYVLEVSASQIDELRKIMTMNEIMVVSFTKVLEQLHPDKAYVDAADVNPERFAVNLRDGCSYPVEIISEHKADDTYPVVSAASILAKVSRDHMVRELEREIGMTIGSGYPSDPNTREFLSEILDKNTDPPLYIRRSWKTVQKIVKEIQD